MSPSKKVVIFLIVIISMVLLRYGNFEFSPEPASLDPERAELEETLKYEYSLIPLMPGAIEDRYSFSNKKKESVLITSRYMIDCSYDEIREYYDTQLRGQGWQFVIEENLTDWFRDLGGKSLRYKKGDFVANVQYAGEQADYGWTYAFSMSWGLRD